MEPFKCKNCGSTDFIEKNGMYVCQYCGSQYPIPQDKATEEDQPQNTQVQDSQYNTTRQSDVKTGYVDASSKKPKKKRGCLSNFLIAVVVIIVLAIIVGVFGGSDSDNETVETKVSNEDKTADEEGGQNAEAVKESSSSPINDFNYEISGNEVILQSYRGKNSILEITPSYTVDDAVHSTNLMDFQISNNRVKTIIFDEGITEINTSLFNGSDIENIYFPSTMVNVYDYTLSYLHPDEGDKVKIYYGGTEEQWNSIFTEYQRTSIGDAEFGAEMGVAVADALNELVGADYDSSEFEYFFSASPQDLK